MYPEKQQKHKMRRILSIISLRAVLQGCPLVVGTSAVLDASLIVPVVFLTYITQDSRVNHLSCLRDRCRAAAVDRCRLL